MSKFYITTPIYYVNDQPHLGHAYTTVAADVLARYHRLKGDDVFFLTGTDEHGAKIAQSAAKAGLEPQQFVDQISQKYKDTWQALQISHDHFVRTTDPQHQQSVQAFIKKLMDQGAIYEGQYAGLYCVGCEKFIKENELVDGRCPDHGTAPELIKEKNYFFKLTDYLDKLKYLISKDELKILPEEKKNEALGLIEQGLEDISISRSSVKWGIPLPNDPQQVIYVWVDALLNYISAIGYGRDSANFQKWWPADLHLMAKDILKFHAIFWPALLLAAGERLPKTIFAHGFFTINGEKMSKTKGNVINPNDLIKKFGSDATRYLLLSQFSFSQDGDLKIANFAEKYNADLANNLGNLVSRVANMIERYFDGQLPDLEIETEYDLEKVNRYLENFQFDKALAEVQAIIARANQCIEDEKPWELAQMKNMDKLARLLAELSLTIREIALVIEPFLPQTAQRIDTIFNQEKIVKTEPLFPRLYSPDRSPRPPRNYRKSYKY